MPALNYNIPSLLPLIFWMHGNKIVILQTMDLQIKALQDTQRSIYYMRLLYSLAILLNVAHCWQNLFYCFILQEIFVEGEKHKLQQAIHYSLLQPIVLCYKKKKRKKKIRTITCTLWPKLKSIRRVLLDLTKNDPVQHSVYTEKSTSRTWEQQHLLACGTKVDFLKCILMVQYIFLQLQCTMRYIVILVHTYFKGGECFMK